MARIVAVHGIGQQVLGPEVLKAKWWPALQDGLWLAGGPPLEEKDLGVAFYGDLFRRQGTKAFGDPWYEPADLEEGFEQDLLVALWEQVAGPGESSKARTPDVVQRALNALSYSSSSSRMAERLLIGFIKQVHAYLTDEDVRARVQKRVESLFGADTQVVVGHSLGSVVAYEAVCAHRGAEVTLVTLGSPLGIRNLVFDRLRPGPVDGHGVFPARAGTWWNIADGGDVVALVKDLSPLFGDGTQVRDVLVHNDSRAHDIVAYLTARETGRAIAGGLS